MAAVLNQLNIDALGLLNNVLKSEENTFLNRKYFL